VSLLVSKGVAIAGLVLVTLLNTVSTRLAAGSADFFLFFKFFALVGVAVIGIVVAVTGFSWQGNTAIDWKTKDWFEGTKTDLSNLAVALYAGLWAFDGWDNVRTMCRESLHLGTNTSQVNFVIGELLNPSRDLSRIVHTTFPLVITAYLLANTAYFLVLPFSVSFTSETIAVAFGDQVLGSIGALIFCILVSGSCFGALNATTFTSSRLYFAAAKEGYLPSVIGTLGISAVRRSSVSTAHLPTRSSRQSASSHLFNTPIPALLLNLTLTSIYIALGSFGTLVTFYGVAGYLFYFLTVLGLLVLRVREPALERPYRCWIVTPIVFCCVSLFLLSRSVVAQPLSSMSVVGFLVAGTIVFYWRVRPRDGGIKAMWEELRSGKGRGWMFWRRGRT